LLMVRGLALSGMLKKAACHMSHGEPLSHALRIEITFS
jgi:hypothetical protein